jgi:hypothetical protein
MQTSQIRTSLPPGPSHYPMSAAEPPSALSSSPFDALLCRHCDCCRPSRARPPSLELLSRRLHGPQDRLWRSTPSHRCIEAARGAPSPSEMASPVLASLKNIVDDLDYGGFITHFSIAPFPMHKLRGEGGAPTGSAQPRRRRSSRPHPRVVQLVVPRRWRMGRAGLARTRHEKRKEVKRGETGGNYLSP